MVLADFVSKNCSVYPIDGEKRCNDFDAPLSAYLFFRLQQNESVVHTAPPRDYNPYSFKLPSAFLTNGRRLQPTWRLSIQWRDSKHKTGSNRFRSYISVYKLQEHSFALYIRHFPLWALGWRLLSLRKKPFSQLYFPDIFLRFPLRTWAKQR